MNIGYNEMDVYRDIWRVRLATGNPSPLYNDSVNHARTLITELLRFAKREVWIYCSNLGEDVWGQDDVYESLGQAIANGVRINVLVQNQPGKDNKALARLDAANIIVRITSSEFKPNFIVVDGKAFRFEEDPSIRKGVACANDQQMADALISKFNALCGTSTPVNPKTTAAA